VLIKSENNSKGRVDYTVTVPKNSHVSIDSGQGDVTAAGLGAGIDVTARGDIHLSALTGPVQAHFVNGRHDAFAAHDVQGDLTLDGDVNDLTLSEIKGNIVQNGNILGDVHFETLSGAVHIHTSVTTIDLAALPGDLTLDSDDLRITGAKGPAHVITRSKDIDLSQIDGDTSVENQNGSVRVTSAGNFGIEARNHKGDVEVTLLPQVSATVNGHTHNGDIISDFGLAVSGDEDKSVTGKLGAGLAHIDLTTDNGDVHIKRGSAADAASAVSPATGSPESPNSPHLKSKKTLPQQPVAQ
jgi:DUF4097 and DUF4098 domain-containing protein YvlB